MPERFTPVPRRETSVPEEPNTFVESIEAFRRTPIKIAVQKGGGSLTEISRDLLRDRLGILVPVKQKHDRSPVSITEDGQVGVVYARNKDLTRLVEHGAVDLAIVGSDRVMEDQAENK